MTTTVEVVDLRCPVGPRQLLLKLHTTGERAHVNDDNLMEISCRDCTRTARRSDPGVVRVLHRFNFIGELVESVVER